MSRRAPWTEHLNSAFRSIAAHRMRSFLTTLGIIIGVFAVVAVVSITRSLEKRILVDMRADKGRVFSLSAYSPDVNLRKVRFQRISTEMVNELREQVPQIQMLSPMAFMGQHELKHRGLSKQASVNAIDENGAYLQNMEFAHGRGFTTTDRLLRLPLVVLGSRLAQDLGLGKEHLGQAITLAGQTAELVGILEKGGFMGFDMNGESAFVPFGSFKGLAPAKALEFPRWTLFMDESLSLQDAKDRVRDCLRAIRGLKASDPDNFSIRTNERWVEQVAKVTTVLMAAAGGMVGISLLVGGIGVMNIMLVSVTERTREIGLRKSLGARSRDVLLQFLIEAMLLCGLGGLLGLALGALVGDLVGRLVMKVVAGLPVWAMVTAFLVPAGTGLVFGLYPARKAAKLDPIEALRAE